MYLLKARGVKAIELLADLLDPISEIASDQKIITALRLNRRLEAVEFGLRDHPETLLKILAICEGVPFDEYNPSALEIPAKLLFILNHPDVASLFTSQAQTEATSFGPATENTEAQNG